MSKCENCIHNEVCHLWCKGYAESCDHYKDKSLFVELPCKVGDKVYTTDDKPNEVTECEITSFTVDFDGVGGFSYEPLDKIKAGFSGCDCLIQCLNETVFLTKEEAEAKLKEIEK